MNTIKAVVVVSVQGEVYGHSIEVEGSEVLQHFIPNTDIKDRHNYIALIKSNHPEYDFTEDEALVMMTPTDPKTVLDKNVAPATFIHPDTQAAFITDNVVFETNTPIPSNVDVETGEVKEVNTKSEPVMETRTKKEPQAQATSEAPKKVSLARKARYVGAVGLGVGVRTATLPTHLVLQSAANVLQLAADAVRNVEALAIDKLNTATSVVTYEDGHKSITRSTRTQIKSKIERRSKRIEDVVVMPITIPVGIIKAIRNGIKNPIVQPQVQTA